MAVKKSELYSTLWKCCDELRGGMDASQYKDYVLVILFVKYISDKSRSDEGFDIDIPEGCYFEDFVALKGNPNIGEEMNKKMAALAEANQLDGVFVADFEDDAKLGKGKDKVETLSKLIAVFQNENLDFSKNRAADDDLIGDAYEYLMKNFATESGKSKGQFYTPAEVSRVMAKVIGLGDARNGKKTTIYDPTCGSGSLLLRAMCETPDGATIYGQEKDNATLPANLFYGTGIPACIIIVEKSEAVGRKGVFMIDAKSGYIKDGAKNRLREQDIRRIVDVWQAQRDVPHYARFVPMEEIERNDYNLNIPRYVSAPDTEILQDIDAHLHGGLPKHDIDQLDAYWEVCPSLCNDLFCDHPTRKGYYSLKCNPEAVRDVVAENIDFRKQSDAFRSSFTEWCNRHRVQLYALVLGFAPKKLIEQLGNSLLEIFKVDKSLVDAYDVYDCLMNYWGETMQDDCYMISSGGWTVQLYTPQPASKKNDEKKKEKKATTPEDIVCDLLPVPIVIDEYFAEKRDVIAAAEELLAQNEGQLAELVEEQAENYLDEDNFPDSKITDANVKKRIKALDKKTDADEVAVLQKYLDLKGDISLNKKLIKERKYDLLTALVVKYADLSEEEIKRLVIEKKWFASLALRLDGEMQRISQQLTSKVSALAERYAQTLSEIDADIIDLEAKVAAHLKQMGY